MATFSSDNRMLPEAPWGFSQVVRGTTKTDGRGSVSRRGLVIDAASVAPGAFAPGEVQTARYGGEMEARVPGASAERRR
ncbi:fimbria/pilus outer membrane usher protein, partial [Pseudomonas aeruginosa]